MASSKIVVAGATGLVGSAALRHFGGVGGCEVVAPSRRKPRDLYRARHVPVDLTDPVQCGMPRPDCRAQPIWFTPHSMRGRIWSMAAVIPNQIRTNDEMLRNLMAVLEPASPSLRHVALLLGTKAYGVHVRPLTLPAREGRSEMYQQPNFYWAQENLLRGLQAGYCLERTARRSNGAVTDEHLRSE